jgi:AFG3 family protein
MAYRLISSTRKLEKLLFRNLRQCNHNVSKNNSTFRTVLNQWRVFCEKPPKGFEKYFEPGSKQKGKDAKTEPQKEAKETKGKDAKQEQPKPPPKSTTTPPGGSKSYDQWSFGLFGGTGRGGSGGKPFGDGDRDKWYILGAGAAIAFLATVTLWEMGYKEIGWKEFVHSYLARGIVEKLEVVNKKWVRVRLLPGNTIDGANFVWFNIGSVDSFERNLENAQIEMNIEPPNFLPVIYKTEVEAASLSGILPTLLVIGFLIYMMRRSAEMMGGKKGRRGGGLFGGVMESTAKLINSNDIGVRFKSVSLLSDGPVSIEFFAGTWPAAKRPKSK